ncbi:hypothetical protein EJ08DRAFT_701245 [Tothia fuscella]|uniref:Uncharacterized protein n=1 Tax=Tothia fuscella TaxID=1048955 RepID=A0A9P4TTR6_9PEZI|nr:hypothetical protein EJ08DRAFT_701245 [Tothia fuscella]
MPSPRGSPDNDSRASIDSTREDYNRITIPSTLKTQIYSQIADSSESIPLDDDDDSDEEVDTKPQTTIANTKPPGGAQSKLSQSLLSSDFPTPTPEKPNPMEQVSTPNAPTSTSSKLLSPGDNGVDGDSMSRQTTATSKNSGDGMRPKLGGRPSTMRRITSAIKKTVSNNKHE